METDWRLFTTLLRFDAVYQIHFKCSIRKLIEYENLWPYARDLYQWPGVVETVSFDEIRDALLPHPPDDQPERDRGHAAGGQLRGVGGARLALVPAAEDPQREQEPEHEGDDRSRVALDLAPQHRAHQ